MTTTPTDIRWPEDLENARALSIVVRAALDLFDNGPDNNPDIPGDAEVCEAFKLLEAAETKILQAIRDYELGERG